MTRVTVLVPTHDHGRLVRHSIRSALQQTHADLEVFVVGDGAPGETAEAVLELAAKDDRVRWFPFEKGPRHGEVHRARALEEATGDVLAFLSDDDLYLPDHLERMVELLADADLVHSPGCARLPDATYRVWPFDLAQETSRRRVLERAAGSARPAGFPHSFGALTMDLYRRVPGGLTTTPDGISTDVYFWSRCLGVAGVRCRAGATPTVLLLESTQRRGVELGDRDAELAALVPRLAEPTWRAEFDRTIAALYHRHLCDVDARLDGVHRSRSWRLLRSLRALTGG